MAILVAGPILGLVVATWLLVPRFKQFCGEAAVYRIGLGLHACEANDEAADDFSCTEDIGGLREALLPRDLSPVECAQGRPHQFVPWLQRITGLGLRY